MMKVDWEDLLEEIHIVQEHAKGSDRYNLRTIEKIAQKLISKSTHQKQPRRSRTRDFVTGSMCNFLAFWGFFNAIAWGVVLWGLVCLSGGGLIGMKFMCDFLRT